MVSGREYRLERADAAGEIVATMQLTLIPGLSRGAILAQLTSDRAREDAHRFYGQIGYVASHEGFKLTL